jgi:hypothetical protein
MRKDFFSEDLKVRDHLEEPDVDGTINSECFRKTGRRGVDWIHLAQDTVRW